MICEKCGRRRVVVIRKDIVFDDFYNIVYYCPDCDEKWMVIEKGDIEL